MVPPMPSIGPLTWWRLLYYQNNVWSMVNWDRRVNTNLDLDCPAQPICRNQLFRPFMKYTAFSQISQRHIACGIFLLYTYYLFSFMKSYNWQKDIFCSKILMKVSSDSLVTENSFAMSNTSFSVHNKYFCCLSVFVTV